ncbi:universal stress protein [Halobacteriales archaeon Cl-PHB]
MTTYLVATASVHTTAAACDYLAPSLGADDTVLVLTVEEAGMDTRDAGDAQNVAQTRFFEPTVVTVTKASEPAAEILAVAADRGVDEILLGATSGDPQRAEDPPGSTVRAVLAESEWPVTVLPDVAPA